MDRVIQALWWIGLLGALVATLAIVKQVLVLLRTLRQIHQLAETTLAAAEGIADNVDVGPKLAALGPPLQGLRRATAALVATTNSLERTLQRALPSRVS